jgi:two-component system chemotaxis response regulator CheY
MKTILLIDDNRLVTDSLASVIKACLKDCLVITAGNGMDGATIMDTIGPDLIVTDLQMPVMDGFGVIAYRNDRYPHVPLYVMSGDLSPDVRSRLRSLGITRYFEKPLNFDAVAQKIAQTIDLEPDTSSRLAASLAF